MTILAYLFIIATIVTFVGIFIVNKERDGEFGYIIVTLAMLTMAITGIGLALHVLGFEPRITF